MVGFRYITVCLYVYSYIYPTKAISKERAVIVENLKKNNKKKTFYYFF
jgi:hypothetical protein